MKKKYLILSILFAFVFILTSCGAESDKPGQNAGTGTQPG